MGVYIKGMEMPKSYKDIRIYEDGRIVSKSLHTYGEEIATAVSVPPHGDLIDYDFCMKNYVLLHDDDGKPVYAVRMMDINNAPTIIPAEEGET